MDMLKLVSEMIDEAESLNNSAPTEPEKTTEFITKMTASIIIGSLARCLLNARSTEA